MSCPLPGESSFHTADNHKFDSIQENFVMNSVYMRMPILDLKVEITVVWELCIIMLLEYVTGH